MTWHEGEGSASPTGMRGGWGQGAARRLDFSHDGALVSASRTAPSPGGVLSVADTETARAWIADVLAVHGVEVQDRVSG